MKKILFINPFGIGDVLFTTPVIRAVKEHYPQSVIGYWCNKREADIFKSNPLVDKVFALSRGDIKKIYQESILRGLKESIALYRAIKKEHFDVALDFSLDHRYSLVAKLAGIKKRIGFDYKKRGRFLTDKIEVAGYSSKHVTEYYLELLKFLDIEPKRFNLDLGVSEDNKAKALAKLRHLGVKEQDLVVGIAAGAGASWGKDALYKHWPAIRFAQVADKIIDKLGAKVIILGDSQDKKITEVITAAMRNKPVDLTAKTNLDDFVSLISNLQVLVTNDGGPLHIAVALGVKTVSIFGPVDDAVYGPYPPGPRHAVIKKGVTCRPCYKNFRFNGCINNRACLDDISVDEVYSAVEKLLGT